MAKGQVKGGEQVAKVGGGGGGGGAQTFDCVLWKPL